MAEPVNSVKMKLAYNNTDFTRTMTISEVAESVLPNVETSIQSINDSLAAGTSGGLDTFFIADDYDAAQSIGSFKQISQAVVSSVTETDIPLS